MNINQDQLVKEARKWLHECIWSDEEEEVIDSLSDARILRGIREHYTGGLEQFILDTFSSVQYNQDMSTSKPNGDYIMIMTVAQATLLTSKYLDYNYYLDDDGQVHVSRFSVDDGFEYILIDRKGKVS